MSNGSSVTCIGLWLGAVIQCDAGAWEGALASNAVGKGWNLIGGGGPQVGNMIVDPRSESVPHIFFFRNYQYPTMYNGISLQTHRGSNTSGHVQANVFTVKARANRVVTVPSKDFKSGQGAAGVIRGPNKDILEDERKKQIYRNF
ncbi:pre-mRNA-splicing factor CWC21 [Striga asiatica]|uniref:Pre-mRNA-splicing factor CWC21 n=1 Tax=Striga asiatica TaxID=4170 RepID=A0A5A7R552_STRAF|nr:pre-mRNA-splicing factor CWC21 [Striga asiatica]